MLSRKLGKNENLFHLNMNFFKSQTEKVSCWAARFRRNVSMRFREKRKSFIISLKFRAHLIRATQLIRLAQFIRAAHFPHPGSITTSLTLKSVIPFLFDFIKRSCLGEKDSHFCLVYGKVYQKILISLLFHVPGNTSFSGLNFHIQDVEIEPPKYWIYRSFQKFYFGNLKTKK